MRRDSFPRAKGGPIRPDGDRRASTRVARVGRVSRRRAVDGGGRPECAREARDASFHAALGRTVGAPPRWGGGSSARPGEPIKYNFHPGSRAVSSRSIRPRTSRDDRRSSRDAGAVHRSRAFQGTVPRVSRGHHTLRARARPPARALVRARGASSSDALSRERARASARDARAGPRGIDPARRGVTLPPRVPCGRVARGGRASGAVRGSAIRPPRGACAARPPRDASRGRASGGRVHAARGFLGVPPRRARRPSGQLQVFPHVRRRVQPLLPGLLRTRPGPHDRPRVVRLGRELSASPRDRNPRGRGFMHQGSRRTMHDESSMSSGMPSKSPRDRERGGLGKGFATARLPPSKETPTSSSHPPPSRPRPS